MPTINYPNGASITSTALSPQQMQLIWQVLTLQMLGQAAYFDTATTTLNSNQVTVTNGGQYAVGQEFWLPGPIPPGATIQGISGNVLTLSAAATAAVTAQQCTICAPGGGDLVRVQWPTSGQPDWPVAQDVVFIAAIERDDPYDRIRDQTFSLNNDTLLNQSQSYTRVWRISWMAYGPNSFANANWIRSGLFQDFATAFLASYKLAPVTDYPPPIRAPEQWQQQYFERVDFEIALNELVTETITVSTVASVEVQVYTAAGEVADFTIT